MKMFQLQLDDDYSRTVSVRLPRLTWLAVEAYRQQLANQHQMPLSFSAVLTFLIETYLYEHQQIESPPVLNRQGARVAREKLENEIAILRQQLAEALNHKLQENL